MCDVVAPARDDFLAPLETSLPLAWEGYLADELTELELLVYRYLLREGRLMPSDLARYFTANLSEIAAACGHLASMRLLVHESDGSLSGVSLDTARILLNHDLRREIDALEENLRRSDQKFALLARSLRRGTAWHGIDGVQLITKDSLQQEIDAALLSCTEELLTTHPSAKVAASLLRATLPVELDVLRRGVRRRLIYQHNARASLELRSAALRLEENGAAVRTTSDSFDLIVITDRRRAVVKFTLPDSKLHDGAVITHPFMVSFICHVFERLWSGATAWESDGPAASKVFGEMKLAVLQLMASGLKDEAIAHRLGIAPRTCRRYIASIMEALGATSRVQAGVKIAKMGLIGPEARGDSDTALCWIDAHPLSP